MATKIQETTTMVEDGEESEFSLESPFTIPSQEAFKGEDFLDASADLGMVITDICNEFETEFRHITGVVQIEALWRSKPTMRSGKQIKYDTIRTPPLTHFYAGSDFTIWVSADAFRNTGITHQQVRAMMFHCLSHITFNEKTEECVIRDHEFAGFLGELQAFGPWEADLRKASRAFRAINGQFSDADPVVPETEQASLLDEEDPGDEAG